ncbi:hypothetical protein RDI58_004787 [Solanum bulbocastanum]|uniref:Uncharacterized protein n=1 Tax=Solanum bulbocastanum TaxID=147425 RepID=A0AAN8U574_SOLBU
MDGYVIKAGWPEADLPDLTLKKANKYLQDTIISMRKLLQKQVSGSKKGNVSRNSQNKPSAGLINVDEQYGGWKKECLGILQRKFDTSTCSFVPDKEILSELQKSDIAQQGNFKQIQSSAPLLRFKKDEVAVGVQALDLRHPFGEIEVLEKNSDLIKRQLGLERLEILSMIDDALERAGPHAAVVRQNPPSPGNPTAIFL